VQDLTREVPVVEGLGGVDALVALQPDEWRADQLGQRFGKCGLASARLAFQQQRAAHREGEEGDRRQALVCQVARLT
jgi:hypothetical protein